MMQTSTAAGIVPGRHQPQESATMRVKILRDTFVRGKLYESGKRPVNIDDADARLLVALGKAEPAAEKNDKKVSPKQGEELPAEPLTTE